MLRGLILGKTLANVQFEMTILTQHLQSRMLQRPEMTTEIKSFMA